MKRIKKMLNMTQDYTVINNIHIGTIYDLFDKIDFNSLFTDDCSHFHGDFILDNIIKTKESYKLLDWRQDFGGELCNGDKYYDIADGTGIIPILHDIGNDNDQNASCELWIGNPSQTDFFKPFFRDDRQLLGEIFREMKSIECYRVSRALLQKT